MKDQNVTREARRYVPSGDAIGEAPWDYCLDCETQLVSCTCRPDCPGGMCPRCESTARPSPPTSRVARVQSSERGVTNEDRRRRRYEARMRRKPDGPSPLQLLGHWMYGFRGDAIDVPLRRGRDLAGAPIALLESAFMNVEMRLRALADRPQSARVRASTRWLARWSERISREYDRQRVTRQGVNAP